MNKITQLVFGILVLALLAFTAFKGVGEINTGATLITGSTYFGATNTSSSVPTVATTTGPVLSLDNTRTNAVVCNNGGTTVFLHQKAISTTTGVVVNEGIPLFPPNLTTSTAPCRDFPGFKGYLFGITAATTSVTVSSWK